MLTFTAKVMYENTYNTVLQSPPANHHIMLVGRFVRPSDPRDYVVKGFCCCPLGGFPKVKWSWVRGRMTQVTSMRGKIARVP